MKTGDNAPGITVSEVRIRLLDKPRNGLVGWASCVINEGLFLNNIAIRISRNGKPVLSYPSQKSRGRSKHYYFNPISRMAARILEKALLGNLDLKSIKGKL